jgi:hypothetical protein
LTRKVVGVFCAFFSCFASAQYGYAQQWPAQGSTVTGKWQMSGLMVNLQRTLVLKRYITRKGNDGERYLSLGLHLRRSQCSVYIGQANTSTRTEDCGSKQNLPPTESEYSLNDTVLTDSNIWYLHSHTAPRTTPVVCSVRRQHIRTPRCSHPPPVCRLLTHSLSSGTGSMLQHYAQYRTP